MKATRNVLNLGFVELVDMMGDDFAICQAARVSTGSEASKGEEKDRALIRYLYRNKHTSPFEMVELKFHLKMPLFVARQWIRHRMASLNEMSGRYREIPDEFFIPDELRKQDTKNKQGSAESFSDQDIFNSMLDEQEVVKDNYHKYLFEGVSRELARIDLPLSTYTEFFWKIDLHNLLHFLYLRDHPHAQHEIQVYAKAILSILDETGKLPWSLEIFEQYRQTMYLVQEAMNIDKEFEDLPEALRDFISSKK